jgi:carbon monoxide dehydrogenase subunit G
MLKRIIIGVVLAIVVIVVGLTLVIATQPEDFNVSRTTTIKAAPEKVFDQVNDFHKWDAWSPWAKIDPNMKTTYSGPESGQGASYAWVGNDDVGEGKMTIAESHPGQHVKIDLEFIKPFAAKNVTEFMFKPEGDATEVTWSMNGKNGFMGKAMCLVMSMDKMVGGDFEKGLAQMKNVVETSPR